MAASHGSLHQHLKSLLGKLNLIRPFIDAKTSKQITNEGINTSGFHVDRLLRKQIELESKSNSFLELIELSKSDPEAFSLTELQTELDTLTNSYHTHFNTLLSAFENANSPCLITFNAGAGGVDSDDWVNMLKKMYAHHALRHQRQVQCIEANQRSAVLEIQGNFAYAWYQFESGVHRLIRLNPSNIRHTAFASISVTPTSPDVPLEIHQRDLEIQTFKSSGKGGQHVNKTESAVRIVHIPTGISIKCQQERSQHSNKATAMKLLHHRLLKKRMEEEHASNNARRQSLLPNTFGSQIRSYILHPHAFVKDHISGYTIHQVENILMGEHDLDYMLEESILYRLKNYSRSCHTQT